MKKREFLKKLVFLLTGGPLAYPIFTFISYAKKGHRSITFLHPKDTKGLVFKEGAYLININDKPYALDARCTHLGCTVNFDPITGHFSCPCHGSRFDIYGKKIGGPAPKNLNMLKITRKPNGDLEVTMPI